MKSRTMLYAALALASSMLFAGCWGSSKNTSLDLTGGSSVAGTATAVGIQKCFTCHQNRRDVSNPADNAVTIFDMWAGSKHGNPDPASHASYANFAADPTCGGARCHDPNGDGKSMLQLGSFDRPVVGCEACHGGGSEHYGVGPMAYPFPDATACGQCHSAISPPLGHLGYHPNGFGGKGNPGIYAAYAGSAHAQSSTLILHGGTTANARCSKCHTDEGARKFSLIDNVSSGSPIDCAVLYPALTQFSNIQCRTCHKAHDAGNSLLKPATTGRTAQYNTCIACHQDQPQLHTSHANLLTRKHSVGAVNTGIVVNPASANACTECHNPHSAEMTENLQFAASGHGDNNSLAWSEDDFKASTSSSYCKRCHTTTSYQLYTDNQNLPYNSAAHTAAFAANGVTGTKFETLLCRACHKINAATGYTVGRRTVQTARVPGAWDNGQVTRYSWNTLGNYGDSNLCMNCHSGRLSHTGSGTSYSRSGLNVIAHLAATGTDNVAMGNNAHHAPADWTVFQDNGAKVGGYPLTGKNYANPSYYAHNKIGTTAATHGGTQLWADNSTGPCVGCHMSSPNVAGNNATGKHSFSPVAKDNTGVITAVTSTTCVKCHEGTYALTAAALEEAKDAFLARLGEFDAALKAQGIYRAADWSNFYTDNALTTPVMNWTAKAQSIVDNTAGVNTVASTVTAQDLYGACWNGYYFTQEGGIWAHNNIYVTRLLFDSIQAVGKQPSFARP